MQHLLTNTTNLNQAILRAFDTHAERPCLHMRIGKRYRKFSYRQVRQRTLQLAHDLHLHGITGGEKVALVADNSLDWLVTYLATLLCGGSVVPLNPSLAAENLLFVLADAGARVALLPTATQLSATVASLRELQTIYVIEESHDLPAPFRPLRQITAPTNRLTAEAETAVLHHAHTHPPHPLTTLLYLPGDDGRPQGVTLTHSQCLIQLRHLSHIFPFDTQDLVFTAKTWSEPQSLAILLYSFLHGVPIVAASEGDTSLLESLQQTSPTVVFATPHNLEQFYKNWLAWLARQPESNQKVFQWALTKSREHHAAGDNASLALQQAYRRADMTFFAQLRGQVGGRLRLLYSTGATLPLPLTEFYAAIGLPILNLYSLAQSGGFPAASHPDAYRAGSCGRVTPDFEVKIAADGELLVRGTTLMLPLHPPADPAPQTMGSDGWLYSGDLGHLDDEGYLFITGRQQNSLVLSIGRRIIPVTIEALLQQHPLVAATAVFGDNRPYLTALILPHLPALAPHLPPNTPLTDARLTPLFDTVLQQTNKHLDRWAQIQRYHLLDPAQCPPDDLTPLRRKYLAERYAAAIAAMYPATQKLEMTEISQVQVDPERLRALLEKESLLDAWMTDAGIEFIFNLARDKQIDAPSMIHICDAVATIAQIESEEKPLSTALIVGDPMRIARVLPESQIQLLHHDHIRRMRHALVTLAKLVDGKVLGYILDRYGYVRGIHKLNVLLPPANNVLLGPQFRHHAAISQQCNALVFFVPYGGKQVRVFANGELVGRYANGDWSPDNLTQVDQVVQQLAERRGYDLALLQRILRCAFQMSENNQGAIFMFGDANRILQQSDAAEISAFAAILSAHMAEMSDEELINFARQDGATVIDVNGRFRNCMVLLRPDAQTQAEIGAGRGARHSSAAKMSAEADCLAITISQDGPITVYDGGKRVLLL